MQELPYFHPFPSIPVLTWVAQTYPSWLADVGLSCLPYIVTPSQFAQKLMPVVTFITFVLRRRSAWIFYCSTCVFPVICTLTVSTLTLLMSSDVNRARRPHWHECCVVSDCRRAREGAPEAAGGEGADQRCPEESERGAGAQDLQSRRWQIHQPCHNVRTHNRTRACWLTVYFTLHVTPTSSSLCHM